MELVINTTNKDFLLLSLRQGGLVTVERKIKTNLNQSEKLWPALDALLRQGKVKAVSLKKVVVANGRGSFTSLRIGIAAANALAFAWQLPVEDESGHFKRSGKLRIIEPRYDGEINISSAVKAK